MFLGTSNDVSVCDLAKLTCFAFGACDICIVIKEAGGGGTTGGNTGRGPSNFVDSSSSGTQVYLSIKSLDSKIIIPLNNNLYC